MHGEAVLTIPVRSSNSNAPRLHQSHASVIRDTPPISEREETRSRRYKVRFAILPLGGRNKPILSLLATLYLEHSTSGPWLCSRSRTEPHSTGQKRSSTLSL